MHILHQIITNIYPTAKLWFMDGKNQDGKVISNPNIGYGSQKLVYVDGKTKEFYQLGISSNTKGISLYIMGIDDKKLLLKTYGNKLGKASISGYCIKFKTLNDINLEVLKEIINFSFYCKTN